MDDEAAFRRAVGPGAFITSWRNFLFIIIGLAALAYGWRVTQVDFVSLVVNLPKSERIFTGLMQPDVIARVTETSSVQAPLQVGGVAAGQPSTSDVPGGGTLTVSPSPVQPGAQLTIVVSPFGTITKRDDVESQVIPLGAGCPLKVSAVVTLRPAILNTRSGPGCVTAPPAPNRMPVSVM